MTASWLILILTALGPSTTTQDSTDQLQEDLRNRIEAAGHPLAMSVRGERVYSSQALPTFYEQRAYAPAWNDGRRPLPAAWDLLRVLRAADQEGLRPIDYHLSPLDSLLAGRTPARPGVWTETQLVDLDLLLTDAFLIYGSHLLSGRVDPMTVHAQWVAVRRERDLVAHLAAALANGDSPYRARRPAARPARLSAAA